MVLAPVVIPRSPPAARQVSSHARPPHQLAARSSNLALLNHAVRSQWHRAVVPRSRSLAGHPRPLLTLTSHSLHPWLRKDGGTKLSERVLCARTTQRFHIKRASGRANAGTYLVSLEEGSLLSSPSPFPVIAFVAAIVWTDPTNSVCEVCDFLTNDPLGAGNALAR